MPGADASQYTRYLKSAAATNANTFEKSRSDRNSLSLHVIRESAANSFGFKKYLPSLIKPSPITASKIVTIIGITEGGQVTTSTFTYLIDGGDPTSFPDTIADGGYPNQ
jgi:hypothetical protein